jgi:hypothetical protein
VLHGQFQKELLRFMSMFGVAEEVDVTLQPARAVVAEVEVTLELL